VTFFAPPPSLEDAPRALRESLAREAAELEARLADLSTVDADRGAVVAELEAVRAAASEERRRALPILGVAHRTRCDAAWDALAGEGRARTCTRCGMKVADPRRIDAERLRGLLGKGPLFARPDGTVMASECPRATRRRAMKQALAVALTLVALMIASRAIAIATTPAATLQYLSWRSDVGHRPSGMPHQVAIAPRAPR
jgi:hypothetical protein